MSKQNSTTEDVIQQMVEECKNGIDSTLTMEREDGIEICISVRRKVEEICNADCPRYVQGTCPYLPSEKQTECPRWVQYNSKEDE